MRETNFIEQNKDKWAECEEQIRKGKTDPDKLSNLFIQVTDDLSYSRSFYPARSVRVYLNNLAQSIFYSIYKNKKGNRRRFIEFWRADLPDIAYQCRKQLLLALAVFLLAVGIGVLSSANDPEFPKVILGDDYVHMTNENIKNGDPMGVYKKSGEIDMWAYITLNNIKVDFLTFVLGILSSLGTIAILVYNGIMVGTFQYFFYQRGVFWESFLSIWLHGTLEMSTTIIAAGAGIVMGNGLLFPGTYSRLQSFQISARRGLKLLIGIVPLTLFAAVIESFVTRYTNVPAFLKAGIILASLFFVLAYFVWYPIIRRRRGLIKEKHEAALQPSTDFKTDTGAILSNGEVLFSTFMIYKKILRRILIPFLVLSGLFTVFAYYYGLHNSVQTRTEEFFYLYRFFRFNSSFPLLLAISGLIGLCISFSYRPIQREYATTNQLVKPKWFQHLVVWFNCTVLVSLFNLLIINGNGLLTLVYLMMMPPVMLALFIISFEKTNFMQALQRSLTLSTSLISNVWGLYFTIALIGFIYQLLINSPLLALYIQVINWNLATDPVVTHNIVMILMTFTAIFSFTLILPLFYIAMSTEYFSLKEIKDATSLTGRIKLIGSKKRQQGFEDEK